MTQYTYAHTRPWGFPKSTSVLFETFLGYAAHMCEVFPPHPCKALPLPWPCRAWPPVLELASCKDPFSSQPQNPHTVRQEDRALDHPKEQ